MSKYYKAEDVINAIEDKIAEYIPVLYGRYCEMPLEIRMAIERLPSIDIVHCGECKYWKSEHICIGRWGWYGTMLTEADAFCSYGERIDNE